MELAAQTLVSALQPTNVQTVSGRLISLIIFTMISKHPKIV